MMPLLKRSLILLTLFFWVTLAVGAQDDSCPVIVQTALEAADTFCQETGRNQACYGHNAVNADLRDSDETAFDEVGETTDVSGIQNLRMSPLDTEAGVWGLAVMRIQANLPETLPGQNVTLMVFGDTEITNAVEPGVTLPATIQASGGVNVNVRVSPSETGAVIGSLPSGEAIMVTGRSADDGWLRVGLPDETSGWIFAPVLVVDGDVSTLSVVEGAAAPTFGPMQAFYLSTGIGAPVCEEVPQNGLLVQTPDGAGTINLSINDVEIEMGSTVFFQTGRPEDADDDDELELIISVAEGGARARSRGETRPIVPGSQVSVPLDEALRADGEPSNARAYDVEALGSLPLDSLEREVELEDPVTDEEVERLETYEEYFESINVDDYDELLDYINERLDEADSEFDEDAEFDEDPEIDLFEGDEDFEDDFSPADFLDFLDEAGYDDEELDEELAIFLGSLDFDELEDEDFEFLEDIGFFDEEDYGGDDSFDDYGDYGGDDLLDDYGDYGDADGGFDDYGDYGGEDNGNDDFFDDYSDYGNDDTYEEFFDEYGDDFFGDDYGDDYGEYGNDFFELEDEFDDYGEDYGAEFGEYGDDEVLDDYGDDGGDDDILDDYGDDDSDDDGDDGSGDDDFGDLGDYGDDDSDGGDGGDDDGDGGDGGDDDGDGGDGGDDDGDGGDDGDDGGDEDD